MERKKRWLFVLIFVLSGISVALLSASLGTDYWLVSRPVRLVDKDIIGDAKNVTDGDLDTKFQGYINFGLFHGYKELDHGLGVRKVEIWMKCSKKHLLCGWVSKKIGVKQEVQYIIDLYDLKISHGNVTAEQSEYGLFNFALWVSVIVVLILAIVWGLVSMGFAALNASIKPIETITGPAGLYLWNGLAFLFSMTTFILYLVLYFVDLQDNVLTPDDTNIYNWTSKDRSDLTYSFYFVVVATGLFAGNIAVILLSGVECKSMRFRANISEKALDGVMLY